MSSLAAGSCALCGAQVDLRDPARIVSGRIVSICTSCAHSCDHACACGARLDLGLDCGLDFALDFDRAAAVVTDAQAIEIRCAPDCPGESSSVPSPESEGDQHVPAARQRRPAPRSRRMALWAGPVAAGALLTSAFWSTGSSASDAPRPERIEKLAHAAQTPVPLPSPPAVLTEPPAPAPLELETEDVAPAEHWRLETDHGPVHVYTPAGYEPETASLVVYVHGYQTDVDRAWDEHRLAEQFADSGRNALFVAPSAPADNDADPPWHRITALIDAVAAEIGDAAMPAGPRVAVGHSGAFRSISRWVARDRIDHVILIDALYGSENRFHDWLAEAPGRSIAIVAARETQPNADRFASVYRDASIHEIGRGAIALPDEELEARLLYLRARDDHYHLVTGGEVIPTLLSKARGYTSR